jgi:hypothetical protein
MVGSPFSVVVCQAAAISAIGASALSQGPTSRPPSVVRPHASTDVVQFKQVAGAYTLEHPVDWQAHETSGRVTIGPDDGLVASERGFRTIYGVIATIVDDPQPVSLARSIDSSARLIVDAVLKRNPHQVLKTPVHADGLLGGKEAASAVLVGTSPVTGKGERAEIVCRLYGPSQVFYVILVSPADDYGSLAAPLKRLRDSVQMPDGL